MFKYKVFAFIFLITSFSLQAYSQNADHQLTTIAGKVNYVDLAGGVIGVQTKKGTLVFHVSVESDLLRYSHHIASIEIQKDDPVIVQFEKNSYGKNIIVKLVDKQQDEI